LTAQVYRGERGPTKIAGKKVIVVDDGLATGSTMRAAIAALRTLEPDRIAVDVPVASHEAAAAVRRDADAFLCACLPIELYSVGQWYEDFSQTTDAEVLELLRRAEVWTPARRAAEMAEGVWYMPNVKCSVVSPLPAVLSWFPYAASISV
jgi:predicted phosphoribosyltransferase